MNENTIDYHAVMCLIRGDMEQAQIAGYFGVSRQRIQQVIKRGDLTEFRENRNQKYSTKHNERLASIASRLFDAGFTTKHVAFLIGCNLKWLQGRGLASCDHSDDFLDTHAVDQQ